MTDIDEIFQTEDCYLNKHSLHAILKNITDIKYLLEGQIDAGDADVRSELTTQITALKDSLQSINSKIDENTVDIYTNKTSIDELNNDHTNDVTSINSAIDALKEQLSQLEDSINGSIEGLNTSIGSASTNANSLEARIATLENEMDLLQSSVDVLTLNVESSLKTINESIESLNELGFKVSKAIETAENAAQDVKDYKATTTDYISDVVAQLRNSGINI